MPSAVSPIHVRPVTSLRAIFRSSEAALVVLTIEIEIAAGLLTIMQHRIAHGLQKLLYAFPGDSLSASSGIDPVRLIALPIGGLILGFGSRAVLRRWRTPVDVVEANALHGGAVPWKDSTAGLRPRPCFPMGWAPPSGSRRHTPRRAAASRR